MPGGRGGGYMAGREYTPDREAWRTGKDGRDRRCPVDEAGPIPVECGGSSLVPGPQLGNRIEVCTLAQLFVPLRGGFGPLAGSGRNEQGEDLEWPAWQGAEIGFHDTYGDVLGAVPEAEARDWNIGTASGRTALLLNWLV